MADAMTGSFDTVPPINSQAQLGMARYVEIKDHIGKLAGALFFQLLSFGLLTIELRSSAKMLALSAGVSAIAFRMAVLWLTQGEEHVIDAGLLAGKNFPIT